MAKKQALCACCGTIFTAKRSTAKYCGTACKQEFLQYGSRAVQALCKAKHALRDLTFLFERNPAFADASALEQLKAIHNEYMSV